MKKILIIISGLMFSAIFFFLTGCCAHTNLSKFAYYPSGVKNGKNELAITIQGAPCRAFAANTQKNIFLRLQNENGIKLMEKNYSIQAGNLECYWRSPKENNLNLVFFEYGEKYVASKSGRPVPEIHQKLSVDINGNVITENYSPGNVPEWLTTMILDQTIRDDKQQIIFLYFPFPLSINEIESIKSNLRAIAKEFGLHERNMTPSLISSGFLAIYDLNDVDISFRRINYSKEISIEITNYDSQKLSQKLEQRLNKLGPVRNQHSFHLTIPLYNLSQSDIVSIIDATAKKYGVSKDPSCRFLRIACYGNNDSIKIEVFKFGKPEIAVSVYENNSRDAGLKIEKDLREKLPYLGKE